MSNTTEEKSMADVMYDTPSGDQTPSEPPVENEDENKDKETKVPNNDQNDKSDGDKNDQEGSEQEKDSDKKTDKESVPEKYDLKIPDDLSLNQAQIDKIAEISKKHGLSNEEAQGVADMTTGILKSYIAESETKHNQVIDSWKNEIKNDKEFGGDKLEKTLDMAHSVLKRFGNADLRDFLNRSGIGNQPDMVRAFARIGEQFANDTLITGESIANQSPVNIADLFYGGSNS